MVYPYDPLPTPAAGGLRERWKGFLSNPDTRAALLQFGSSQLQPMAVGQTFLGQLGQSLGSAGETVANRTAVRQKQQDASLERRLGIARLGQQGQQIENQQEQFGQSHAVDLANASSSAQNADTNRMNAETAARRVTTSRAPGQITPAFVTLRKNDALKAWDDYDLMTGGTTDEDGTPAMTKDEFVQQYLTDLGLSPEQIDGSAFTSAPAGSLGNAAPAGPTASPNTRISGAFNAANSPAAIPTPGNAPEQQISVQEMNQRWPQILPTLRQQLQSPDPTTRARAQLTLQKLQANVTDPQNLQ